MRDKIIEGVMSFLNENDRLPYEREDEFVLDGKRVRSYRRIKGEFDNQRDLVKHLIDNNYLTYEDIGKRVGDTSTRVKNLMTNRVKRPDKDLRYKLEILLGVDYYDKILPGHHNTCLKCKHECKQHYAVGLTCKKYREA